MKPKNYTIYVYVMVFMVAGQIYYCSFRCNDSFCKQPDLPTSAVYGSSGPNIRNVQMSATFTSASQEDFDNFMGTF